MLCRVNRELSRVWAGRAGPQVAGLYRCVGRLFDRARLFHCFLGLADPVGLRRLADRRPREALLAGRLHGAACQPLLTLRGVDAG